MFNQQDKLDIFENFRIDRKLPKHNKKEDNGDSQYMGVGLPLNEYITNIIPRGDSEDGEFFITEISPGLRHKQRKNWWQRLKWKLRRKPKTPKPKITVEQFFASVHKPKQ